MKKQILLMLLCFVTLQLFAQSGFSKMDVALQRLAKLKTSPSRKFLAPTLRESGRIDSLGIVGLSIESRNPDSTASFVRSLGFRATVLNESFLTAQVHYSVLILLEARDEVIHMQAAKKFRTLLDHALVSGGVNKIHRGEELISPYTGKGVIIGIIDQGFEYQHLAFRSADRRSSRVRALWDRSQQDTQPTTVIPTGGDDQGAGHATHVAAIAAGTEVVDGLRGVAPDAELIFIPSKLSTDELLEDVKYIKTFANNEGKRWIVNMSFGSQIGPHDGSQPYDKNMSELLGNKGFLTAAMGNEGGMNLHASDTLQPGETRYLFVTLPEATGGDEKYVVMDFWANATDGKSHFKLTPMAFFNALLVPNKVQWEAMNAEYGEEINAYNKKQNFTILIPRSGLVKWAGSTAVQFVLKVELPSSEVEKQSFHAWLNPNNGEFSSVVPQAYTQQKVNVDDQYLVGEGAACVPRAFAVGAYNSADSFRSYVDGTLYGFDTGRSAIGAINARSSFSSVGPYLSNVAPKPLVLAPGAIIKSAMSKIYTGFNVNSTLLTNCYEFEREPFYYAAEIGTSMAAPYLAGVLALWLEANPTLTYDQVISVLRKTSIRDVGSLEYSTQNGYGRIDAYAGLKEVLTLANSGDSNGTRNTDDPLTILRGSNVWRLLFNNDESYATFSLYDTTGRLRFQRSLTDIEQGREELLSWNGLSAGVYLLRIKTAASQKTYRLLLS